MYLEIFPWDFVYLRRGGDVEKGGVKQGGRGHLKVFMKMLNIHEILSEMSGINATSRSIVEIL